MRRAILVAALLGAAPAYAEETGRQPVSITDPVTEIPAGEWALDMDAVRFLLDRRAVDQCNADAARVPELEDQVGNLARVLAERKRPEPAWRVAGRWALFGGGLVAAFVLGWEVGR